VLWAYDRHSSHHRDSGKLSRRYKIFKSKTIGTIPIVLHNKERETR